MDIGRTHKLIGNIRDHINREEKTKELVLERKKWLQLTSSLDVLTDSTNAIEFYRSAEYPTDLGAKYLFAYGLLQCIFLAQDAASGISLSILGNKIDWKKGYPNTYLVREIRNDIAGHPTDRNGKAYIYLVQHSLSKTHMEYMKILPQPDYQPSFHDVNVEIIIIDTMKCINDVLVKTVEMLDAELQKHKNSHKDRKMRDIFVGLEYASEKVLLRDHVFFYTAYMTTKEMISECKHELVTRFGSVDGKDSFSYKIKEIEKVHKALDDGLHDLTSEMRVDVEDCLYQYLFDRLYELKALCVEMDQYYES